MSALRIAPFTASPALDPARRPAPDALTDQAARWAEHVLRTARHLPPVYVTRKALDAVAFSLRHGLRRLAVPTKLVGVAAHQPAVEALARSHRLPRALRPRLVVSRTRRAEGGPERLAVLAPQPDRTLAPLGYVQPKHVAWLAPLLGAGGGSAETDGPHPPAASVHLVEVTGLGRRERGLPVTLGVNVRIEPATPDVTQREPRTAPAVLAVRLWRDADGTARMSCPHLVRHSPSGPEWGYRGSGPADCARSVLIALVDEPTADAHYQAFKDEVVAVLPETGAIIQRTAVLAWLAGRAEAPAQTTTPRTA
ncbi:DUF6166 domain-containing protein [Rubrivirga marina]|nr:DUF6166 domain-containing protein [Rubrivirga marina]